MKAFISFLLLLLAYTATISDPANSIDKATIQWIVQTPNMEQVNALFEHRNRYRQLSKSLNIWLLTLEIEQEKIQATRLELNRLPKVTHVMENLEIVDRNYPNDSNFLKQWQLNNTGQFGEVDKDIDATDAWNITTGGNTYQGDTIVIAILDQAVLNTHEDLKSNLWINHGEIPYNQFDDDDNGFVDDIHGWNFKENNADISNNGLGNHHGTAVSGIVGAIGNNSLGVTGVNWNVKIMNIVRGNDLASIIEAYDYVLQLRQKYNDSQGTAGAFIVATNASWGVDSLQATDAPLWCEMYDALGEVGIISVGAAPNENSDVDLIGDMPTTCRSEYLITVTNTNQLDNKVTEAGYGQRSIDLGAPGQSSFTTYNSGRYGYFNGTSAATPYVSGAIALLFSLPNENFATEIKKAPAQSALLVKNALLNGVDDLEDLEEKTLSGGRLNLYKAILQLKSHYENDFVPLTLENMKISDLALFPNPSSGGIYLSFNLNKEGALKVEFISSDGVLMQQTDTALLEQGQHCVFLENNFAPGCYFARVQHGKESHNLVFVKL